MNRVWKLLVYLKQRKYHYSSLIQYVQNNTINGLGRLWNVLCDFVAVTLKDLPIEIQHFFRDVIMYVDFVPNLQSCHIKKKKLEFSFVVDTRRVSIKAAARYTIVAGLVESKVVWKRGGILHGKGSVLKPTRLSARLPWPSPVGCRRHVQVRGRLSRLASTHSDECFLQMKRHFRMGLQEGKRIVNK